MRCDIIVFIDYFKPGYRAGGSTQAVFSLVRQLKKYNFKVFTRDHDKGESIPYSNTERSRFQNKNLSIHYGWGIFKSLFCIRKNTNSLIYLNSFFSPRFTLIWILFKRLRLIRNPLVIAPRGEINPPALKSKSFKKNIFLKIAKTLALYKNCRFQATSQEEFEVLKNFLPAIGVSVEQIYLAPDLVYLNPRPLPQNYKASEKLNIVFLGRIHPIKNIKLAIEILHKSQVPFVFDIYGPEDSKALGYKKECENIIFDLNLSDHIQFKGELRSEDVLNTLVNYEILMAPSKSENFGYFILEGLASGLAPLVSTGTPWVDLKSKPFACFFDINKTESAIQYLKNYNSLTTEDRFQLKQESQTYAHHFIDKNNDLGSYDKLFGI